jgi:hypothetical protein
VLRERTPWAPVGRRIGTLGHKLSRFHAGGNHPDNLCWACMWCNTWVSERTMGALDHGGLYPPEDGEIPVDALIAPSRKPRRQSEPEYEEDAEEEDWLYTPGGTPYKWEDLGW